MIFEFFMLLLQYLCLYFEVSALEQKNKRERPLTDHSLSNIMYEKKISCSQDEVYVQ